MSDEKRVTVLKGFRPLTEEELSVELSPKFRKINNEKFTEETAAEVAPRLPENVVPFRGKVITEKYNEINDDAVKEQEKSGIALIGVISSVLSLFFLPYLFAPVGIILGYFGYRKGDHSLGTWAMGLGAVGLLGTLIVSTIVY